MKFYLSFLILPLFSFVLYSQEYGERVPFDANASENTLALCDMIFSEIPNDFSEMEPYVFNVFFHKVTDENGETPDLYNENGYIGADGIGDGDNINEDSYLEAIRALNINYNKFNIFFKYRGNDIIKNSQLLNINSLTDYENLISFSKTYINDEGDISYKNNALNFYITHSYNNNPLGAWSFPRYLKSEFLFFYNVFQPMGIGPLGSPAPAPYDMINAIVSFDFGMQIGLLRTAENSTYPYDSAGNVNFYWSERVTRDETNTTAPYNANYAGDHVSDSRANTWVIENDPINTETNLRRYRVFGDDCTCNNDNIIAFSVKDFSTFVDNGSGLYTPTGQYYLDAPVFNIMSRFIYDYFDTNACNNMRSLTNGQGARLRCLIDNNIELWEQYFAIDGVACLYEPYKGNYRRIGPEQLENESPFFQWGFDYEFVDCSGNYELPSEYDDISFDYTDIQLNRISKYDNYLHISHPNHSAIRIIQIDEQPKKCYDNWNRRPSSGKITIFHDGVVNNNYTSYPKDSLQINDPSLIHDLQNGLYKIDKQYNDGEHEQNLILKDDD